MTYLVNDPKQFAADSLTGMVAANEDYLTEVHGGVTRATDSPQGEVAVIVGGGSGHYPAFAGWVGPGMAHGAVCGNIFASPSASQVESVVRASDHGGGAVLLFGNYAGDRLQFGAAQSPLGADGIDTRIVTISDDIASDTPELEGPPRHRRRPVRGEGRLRRSRRRTRPGRRRGRRQQGQRGHPVNGRRLHRLHPARR